MSRELQPTRELILDKALDLFNKNGVEAIGVRDIARDLGLSPGNLTYHFSKKEDIIVAIAQRLSELNSQTLQISNPPENLKQFIERFRVIFTNQFQYRCLLLSFVHSIEHYPKMADRYGKTQLVRRELFQENILYLKEAGLLKEDVTGEDAKRMAAHCSLIGRFWLSEYWVDYRDKPMEEMIVHYLGLLASIFLPYVTPQGHQELLTYLSARQGDAN